MFERLADPVAVADGAQPFSAQHLPLHQRRIRSGQIEPGFRALRIAVDPCLRRFHRRTGAVVEEVVAAAVVGIQLNPPPHRHDLEHRAGFRRGGRTGGLERRVGAIELGGEDQIVRSRQLVGAGERRLGCRSQCQDATC